MTITSIVLGRLLDHFDWQFEWSLSTHLPLQFFFPFSPSQHLCYSILFSRALSPPSQKWCLLHMRGMMWPGPLSICDCPHEPHQSPWQCGWGCAHKAPALGEDLQCVTRLWGGGMRGGHRRDGKGEEKRILSKFILLLHEILNVFNLKVRKRMICLVLF